MTRKNIFEILEEKYDIKEEFIKICNLFSNIKFLRTLPLTFQQDVYTIEKLADDIFVQWKQRGSCLNCEEIKRKINLSKDIDNFENIINHLEYYLNIIHLVEHKTDKIAQLPLRGCSEYWMMTENINILIEHLHYKKIVFDDEEKVILVPKDPAAIAVAEISSDDVAFAIMKYHHASLKGNLNEKRRLLVSIANEYEPLLEKPIDGFYEYIKDAKISKQCCQSAGNN